MYKVMIVDDEQFILEGLKKAVPWQDFDCYVVAEASDGVSGAYAIRRYQPDILFTDVRMPNVDGLNMLAGLKSEFPEMQITVLTGIRNFEYAQQAIKLGVTRFLLKPSKMDELREAISAMTANLKRSGRLPEAGAPGAAAPAGEPALSGDCSNFIVRNTLKYIEEHFTEKLTLMEIAEKVYVSQWHLSKLLNRYCGENFSDVVNGVRIKAAKDLLKNPSLSISEVSEMVGFANTAHFSKTFKKEEGITAAEYRNRIA